MKILFVASGRSGGVNAIVKNQGESLRKEGVDVVYFVVKQNGVKGYIKTIPTLRKTIREIKPDVVHAHYGWCAYISSLALAGLDIPMVASLMGNDILDHKWYPWMAQVFRKLFRWQATIVKSQEMRNRVGIPQAMVIPNGVNMKLFRELNQEECRNQMGWSKDKWHVLFLGRRTDTRKNYPLAEEAVALLNKQYKNIKTIEIHCLEGYKNEDTPVVYNAADASILPSFYEGSANALKEAMACGVPLVATPCGDAEERLLRVTGSACSKTYQVEEIATLLEKALKWEGKTNGRQILQEDGLSSKQVAEQLIQIYTIRK